MESRRFPMKPFPVDQIERNVARFTSLRGSADAYVDSRVPGCLRKKFNLIGLGVTENEVHPDLKPNIEMSAVGFNVGMLECEHGNGTAAHAHQTEEVFMPLIGPWQVFWLDDGVERTLTLQPFDMIMWPIGCYRWFRYAGEGKGRLLTIIGGPDAGKVEYLPEHLDKAQSTGIQRNADGTITLAEAMPAAPAAVAPARQASLPRRASFWRRGLALGLLALGAWAAVAVVHAQSYPVRAVKVIVPFPPGGGTDAVARLFATRLSTAMGQPFVVDNRAGATGIIGTNAAAQAPADGYSLLVGSLSSHVLAPLTAESRAADPVKDFAPIGMLAYHPMVLNVHPSVKANNVQEFVAEAKRAKPPLFYASIGNGSLFHFAGAEFNQITGATAEHVPYRGAAPALVDLLGGQVQVMFDTLQSSLPHIQQGRLKAMAVTASTRSPLLPGVPTLAEAGLSSYDVASWVGMFAPANTPPEIVARLSMEVAKLSRDADFVDQARKTGTDIPQMTSAEFAQVLVKDQRKFAEQFKRINLAK